MKKLVDYFYEFYAVEGFNFLVLSGFVNLTISDLSGPKVKTFVNENIPAGTYTEEVNVQSFSGSGVYFYKLEEGGKSFVTKMLLNK